MNRRFLDSRVAIWEPVVERSSTGGEEERHAKRGEHRASVQLRSGRLHADEAGERPAEDVLVAVGEAVDCEARDVVEVTEGPHEGLLARVERPYRPAGRHTEIAATRWSGEIREAD